MAAPIAGDNRAVATDLSDVMGQGPISIDTSVVGSSASGLSGPMEELVRKKSKLLQIDLRNDEYWWPTRLFLVAALAQDYTDVEALVSVRMKARKVGPMLIDGDFGPLTAAAVRDFQQDKNIGVDGIVGPITWRQCVTEPA